MNEYRVFGPPGTGKTTWATGQIKRAFEARGTGKVLVASFTKTAAVEIATRAGLQDYPQAGTLHALAYRQMGRPTIAEGKVKDWNQYCMDESRSAFRLSGGADGLIDPEDVGSSVGDECMQDMQRFRGMMVPRDHWPVTVQAFTKMWDAWKQECEYKDFTDVIEHAATFPVPPGGARVGFFDEVQDFTPLELSLVRKWSEKMEQVILIGDDDQCIYAFKGSNPEAFLDPPLPDDHIKVLKQSYRVPKAVHLKATQWIEQVSRRQVKDYAPRDYPGAVLETMSSWKAPEYIVQEAQEYLQKGKSVMVLASCGYMLRPLQAALREEAVPFHNPWAPRRGDWNPLARGTRKRVTATDRVLDFMRPDKGTWGDDARLWTWNELERFLKHIKAKGVLYHGVKGGLGVQVAVRGEKIAQLSEVFMPEGAQGLFGEGLKPRPEWLQRILLARNAKAYTLPLAVVKKHGGAALMEQPKLTIGTIHSVKGAEADVVFLMPDLSLNGMNEWATRAGEDSIRRMFYVGMTRAKETLIICQKATAMGVEI